MKKNILSIVALIATLLFASCQRDDYASVIPADAAAVASINLATLAEQGDLGNSGIAKAIDQYGALLLKGDAADKVKELIDDPAKIGIDFRSPVYVFAMADKSYGAVMKVHSESNVEELFALLADQKLCSKPVKKDGRMTGKIIDEIDYAFDGNSLVLLAATHPKMIEQLLEQDAEHSFMSTTAFDKMSDLDGSVKLYANSANGIDELKGLDAETAAALSFGNGKATIKASFWGKTDKAQAAIDEAYDNMRKLNGEFDDDMPTYFTAWVGMGVKGEWLLGKLKERQETKEALLILERAIDIEQMLRAVDGDITLVTSADAPLEGTNNWAVMAEVKNSDFMNDVSYWIQSMSDYGTTMKKVGEWRYSLKIDGNELFWGVDDDGDELFFASDSRLCLNSDCNTLDPYEDDIERSYFYAYINLESPAFIGTINNPKRGTEMIARTAKAIVVKSQKKGEVEAELLLKDNSTNALKQIINLIRF